MKSKCYYCLGDGNIVDEDFAPIMMKITKCPVCRGKGFSKEVNINDKRQTVKQSKDSR